MERADRGQNVGGIRALLATSLQQAALLQPRQQRFQQERPGIAVDETGAELAQHRRIAARIGELQAQGVFPVDPGANRLGGLAVGQSFNELHHRDQGQTPRAFRRLASRWKPGCEQGIVEDHADFIAQANVKVAFGKGGPRDPLGFLGNRGNRLRLERHGYPPQGKDGDGLQSLQAAPTLDSRPITISDGSRYRTQLVFLGMGSGIEFASSISSRTESVHKRVT